MLVKVDQLWTPSEVIEPTYKQKVIIKLELELRLKVNSILFSVLSSNGLKVVAFLGMRHFERSVPFGDHAVVVDTASNTTVDAAVY